MKRNNVFIIAIVVLVLLGGYFVWQNVSGTNTPPDTIQPSPAPTSSAALPSEPVAATGTTTPVTPAESANIIVTKPTVNETVRLPFAIQGRARVFENQFNYRVLDTSGKVVKEGSAYANSPDTGQFGDFSIEIASLPASTAGKITIEVFDYSAKDGSKQDIVSIPITLDTTR